MTSEKFESLYSKLNTAQQKAVDTVEGPVMVVAGPGTGKTQILTLRIAQILKKTDTNPENILALTFTESGVFSMRQRLSEIIGSAAYRVVINTFHGFCNEIIKNYPESFPRIIGAESADEVGQIQILENIISNASFEHLKPFGDPFYYLRAILSSINDLKREGVGVARFREIVFESEKNFEATPDLYHEKGAHKGKMKGDYQKLQKHIFKTKELSEIYEKYEEALREKRLYDYSDMIMEVLRVLEQNKNLLLILQETYQYVLVDEHQDTNNAQNRILELLLSFHPNPNIFVVGDEKQAIYRFQGASLENFLYFKKLYPAAELIFLEENYRSTQSILDVAHSLLESEKKLKARAPHEAKNIIAHSFLNSDTENYFLAKDIKRRIEEGVVPGEIAILYRDNKDAFPIINFLNKFGIDFSIDSDDDLFGDLDIKKFILLMSAVNNFGSDEELLKLMHADFLELSPLDVYKIIDFGNKNRISGYEIIKSERLLSDARVESREKFLNLYKNLSRWATDAKNKNLPAVFETLLRDSGFLTFILGGEHRVSGLDKITAFFDEVRRLSEKHTDFSLSDFFRHLKMLSDHKILIKKKTNFSREKGVRLMTAHKSKGLEFEYVYIVNVYDGHWGNKRRPNLLKLPAKVFSLLNHDLEEDGDIEDERRLFYVAITRAKKEVVITYAKTSLTGEVQLPSQFLGELKTELVDKAEEGVYEKMIEGERVVLFSESKTQGIDVQDKEFIKQVFDKNGFSVTALNNYLDCPWKYFYNNLLCMPKAMEKHQLFGNAVHAALKDFFSNNANVAKEYLLDRFKFYLEKDNQWKASERGEWMERGKEALSGYYDFHKNEWAPKVLTEFNIMGILLTKEIRLTGKIDKMELLGDRDVNVVDYKTGKPKTRGEIEGTTQNSNGGIKRQLVFYNLLLNKFQEGRYKMIGGEIDFIEPNERGKYGHEKFVILPEEVLELEELIKKVCGEILNLEFWDKRCEDKKCEWCGLRDIMR